MSRDKEKADVTRDDNVWAFWDSFGSSVLPKGTLRQTSGCYLCNHHRRVDVGWEVKLDDLGS